MLAELESHVANVRVRATGTMGGNLVFCRAALRSGDVACSLWEARSNGERGRRRETPVGDLIAGAYTSNLQPGEILTKLSVPCAKPNHRPAYMKFQVHERPDAWPGAVAGNAR